MINLPLIFVKKQIFLITSFATICTPRKISRILQLFPDRTNARMTLFHFKKEDISLMIKRLGPAKAHDCGNIPIKMIKICSESLTTPLKIKFKQSLKEDFKKPGKKQL